jgi:thiamine biosynthesis lipoprotein
MHPNNDATAQEIAADALSVAVNISGATREFVRESRIVMGGRFEIILVEAPGGLINELFDFLDILEKEWSRFRADSQISELNNADGQPVVVSLETLELISALVDGYRLTNGAFDPTTLPLTVARGYATSRKNANLVTKLPPEAQWPGNIEAIQIDYAHKTISLPIGTVLDPGGLGKGLAADLVIRRAQESGAAGALVNANGDVVCFGTSTDGPSWRIGIEHPFDSESEIAQIKLSAGAVATSSRVYQSWDTQEGRTHHLTDTRTGHANETSVISSSVIAGSGARAELLTKVAFSSTIDEALALATNLGAAMQIVDDEDNAHMNINWERYL